MKVFLGTILLLGCMQGVIAAVLLFRSKRHRQANKLLGVLILLISLATFKVYSNAQGWWDQGLIPILIANFVPFFIIMPVGPLVYFYVKSCLDPRFELPRKDRRHFWPVLLDLVPVLTVFLYLALVAFGMERPNDARWGVFIDDYNDYVDIPRWLSVTIYVWAAWRLLRKAPAAEAARWIRQFLRGFMVFQCIWLVFLVPQELPGSGDWLLDHLGWYPLYIPLVVLSYWLGIKGYLLSQALPVPGTPLPVSLVQPTVQVLERLMAEEKLYRNPDLNLSLLASSAGVAPKTLSTVLNQHLGKSFNEYVNEYRVREVQGRLRGGASRDLTIAGLAYESGFNSLPTFQRAFKAISGVTPREFMVKSGIE
ncbi:MAG TPA: helix-turn-helix transcriptional regulator [Dinghuibacter sp.]|uniref:helix-turn-helix domain-containing protein n=1 Tax=Dinghuibacter sp. TaxID=2024697 RepID=UPI002C9AE76F|nr:helix-turn-helix transcriptional regulator [Dinghuibacter sp.]HTJ13244.1 helix-turn-helix transcriptional regulator [Dinghuibacter sp.]